MHVLTPSNQDVLSSSQISFALYTYENKLLWLLCQQCITFGSVKPYVWLKIVLDALAVLDYLASLWPVIHQKCIDCLQSNRAFKRNEGQILGYNMANELFLHSKNVKLCIEYCNLRHINKNFVYVKVITI